MPTRRQLRSGTHVRMRRVFSERTVLPRELDEHDESRKRLSAVRRLRSSGNAATGRQPAASKTRLKRRRLFSDETACFPRPSGVRHDDDWECFLAVHRLRSSVQLASGDVQILAVRRVGNMLTGRNPPVSGFVAHGIVPALVRCLGKHNNPTLQLEAAWVLSNITSYAHSHLFAAGYVQRAAVSEGAVEMLINMLKASEYELREQALWALVNIIGHGSGFRDYVLKSNLKDRIQSRLNSSVLKNVLPLLEHKTPTIKKLALRVIENIASETDDQIQVVIDAGALNYFYHLLSHSADKIHRYALRAISYVMAGNPRQIQAVIDAGLILKIAMHISKQEFQTQIVAVWAMRNLVTGGSKRQVKCIIKAHVVPHLCSLLFNHDPRVIVLVLDVLLSMLKKIWPHVVPLTDLIEQHGLEKIEQLQYHENFVIYKMAYDIIRTFFSAKYSSYP